MNVERYARLFFCKIIYYIYSQIHRSMDKLSVQRIQTGHPDIRVLALKVLTEIEIELTGRSKVRFTYVLRTFKEQQDLYNLGRTVVNPDGKSKSKPMGNIVTNAKAGQSIHNYGLAIDFALIIDGKDASWDSSKDWDGDKITDWQEVVRIFKRNGWEWGGDWKTFKDEPHFQYDFGYSWQQLQAKWNAGDVTDGYVNLKRQALPVANIYRTTASVNLRTGPSTSQAVILVVLKGEMVTQTGTTNGGWSEVLYNGKKGFISSQYLTK